MERVTEQTFEELAQAVRRITGKSDRMSITRMVDELKEYCENQGGAEGGDDEPVRGETIVDFEADKVVLNLDPESLDILSMYRELSAHRFQDFYTDTVTITNVPDGTKLYIQFIKDPDGFDFSTSNHESFIIDANWVTPQIFRGTSGTISCGFFEYYDEPNKIVGSYEHTIEYEFSEDGTLRLTHTPYAGTNADAPYMFVFFDNPWEVEWSADTDVDVLLFRYVGPGAEGSESGTTEFDFGTMTAYVFSLDDESAFFMGRYYDFSTEDIEVRNIPEGCQFAMMMSDIIGGTNRFAHEMAPVPLSRGTEGVTTCYTADMDSGQAKYHDVMYSVDDEMTLRVNHAHVFENPEDCQFYVLLFLYGMDGYEIPETGDIDFDRCGVRALRLRYVKPGDSPQNPSEPPTEYVQAGFPVKCTSLPFKIEGGDNIIWQLAELRPEDYKDFELSILLMKFDRIGSDTYTIDLTGVHDDYYVRETHNLYLFVGTAYRSEGYNRTWVNCYSPNRLNIQFDDDKYALRASYTDSVNADYIFVAVASKSSYPPQIAVSNVSGVRVREFVADGSFIPTTNLFENHDIGYVNLHPNSGLVGGYGNYAYDKLGEIFGYGPRYTLDPFSTGSVKSLVSGSPMYPYFPRNMAPVFDYMEWKISDDKGPFICSKPVRFTVRVPAYGQSYLDYSDWFNPVRRTSVQLSVPTFSLLSYAELDDEYSSQELEFRTEELYEAWGGNMLDLYGVTLVKDDISYKFVRPDATEMDTIKWELFGDEYGDDPATEDVLRYYVAEITFDLPHGTAGIRLENHWPDMTYLFR